MADITVIGNSVVDVIAMPVSGRVFQIGSLPVDKIGFSCGGDALNESVILARFGKQVELISKIGQDRSGSDIEAYLKKAGVSTDKLIVDPRTETSVNIVLVDETGERFFLTNPEGSQRRLAEDEVRERLETCGRIVSFASIFVSPLLDIPAMERLFRTIREERGCVLAADLTKAKNGERFEDMRPLLPYLDYIFPNEEEICLLTGREDVYENAGMLVDAGVSCAVIKRGAKGCVVRTKDSCFAVPAYPVERCVDTTGAGDSFAAGFLWALSEGWQTADCARFANACASCAVEKTGATEGVETLSQVMERFRYLRDEGCKAGGTR